MTLKEKTDQFIKDLNELSEKPVLIEIILFYLYNNCLPKKFEKSGLIAAEERNFSKLIKFSQRYVELNEFKLILETFLSNERFKESKLKI